ncbi:BMP family protein [Roseomonas genomospecies 6]|uniref:BMP family ABC transporter substrate-binding protein n=1 Tax=Roseomonas genomospecies 6 TaxID=214106 RepID=A0A9W7NEE3_9PROT|nr:BMP family ABC transporter substrate-binding protein [Roseomonas genomospecies 6]KAA0677362.1 BMP family ABC transporter substrate-binding protein [Roseomonas genomospecies 6]
MTTRPSRRSVLALGAAGLATLACPLRAQDFAPGLLYAVGQKFDKSFNEGAFTGAERFKEATGIAYRDYLPAGTAQFEQAVASLLRRGVTDLALIGFYYAAPLASLAPKHPAVRFTIVDAVVEAPNVQSVTFKEQEGSFLVGMLAAMASRTGTVGFIGALDIPLIRKFIAGFRQGARHARPDIGLLVNFVGTTPAAFNDPTTGAEVAMSQFQRGADVVFAGAGVSNFGIFAAAKDGGRLAIGVDSNQNHLYPGTILTSMLKRVDLAVERAFGEGRSGAWTPGPRALGLAERGVDYALDEHNRALVTPVLRDRLEEAREAIVQGRIQVLDAL